jgi:cellulase/cellobiase CelA1
VAAASVGGAPAWDDGYVTEIEVVNSGGTALPWTVTVSNASRFDVRLGNTWNATATQDGDTIVLRGQPLPAGRTITAGYQVSAAAASRPRPAACTLTGGPCRLA